MKQIAERDERIASPEAQVAEAAKNAETVEHLCGVIDEKRARTLEDGELLVVSHQPTFRSSCIPLTNPFVASITAWNARVALPATQGSRVSKGST